MKYFLSGLNGSTSPNHSGGVTIGSILRERQQIAESLKESDCLLIADADQSSIKRAREAKSLGKFVVLVRNEPKVVCPLNYGFTSRASVDLIIDMGRFLRDTTLTSQWPQVWPQSLDGLSFSRVNSQIPAFINANKLSFIAGELYSLRRRAIHEVEIAVYGQGWNSRLKARVKILIGELIIAIRAAQLPSLRALKYWFSKHLQSRGPVEDKIATLSNYKIALVIENSREYMSEKLLDALFAGCIPVYVGPEVQKFNIPSGLVVECEPTVSALKAGIMQARGVDHQIWGKSLVDFLQDPASKAYWAGEYVIPRLIDSLELALREKRK